MAEFPTLEGSVGVSWEGGIGPRRNRTEVVDPVKPRLYPENENNFEKQRLGPLSDPAGPCTVEENRNGAFELSMEYPVTACCPTN